MQLISDNWCFFCTTVPYRKRKHLLRLRAEISSFNQFVSSRTRSSITTISLTWLCCQPIISDVCNPFSTQLLIYSVPTSKLNDQVSDALSVLHCTALRCTGCAYTMQRGIDFKLAVTAFRALQGLAPLHVRLVWFERVTCAMTLSPSLRRFLPSATPYFHLYCWQEIVLCRWPHPFPTPSNHRHASLSVSRPRLKTFLFRRSVPSIVW